MVETRLDDLAIVILAAGKSQRFGARNKLLESLEGQPLIDRLFETVSGLPFGQTVVVTGHDIVAIDALATSRGLASVYSPQFSEGMGSSIAAGVRALDAPVGGVLIQLGDVAYVSREVFLAVARTWREERRTVKPIVAPTFEGRRGHPMLFDRGYFLQLMALRGDVGARSIIAEHVTALREIPVSDPFIVQDIDTPDDIRDLAQRLRTRQS